MKNGLRQSQAPEQPFFARFKIKTVRFLSPSPTGGGDFLFFHSYRRNHFPDASILWKL